MCAGSAPGGSTRAVCTPNSRAARVGLRSSGEVLAAAARRAASSARLTSAAYVPGMRTGGGHGKVLGVDFLTDVKTLRERARQQIEQGPVTDAYGADRLRVIDVLNEALAT